MSDKSGVIKALPFLGLLLLFTFFMSASFYGQESKDVHLINEKEHNELDQEEFMAGEMIIEHITDAYEWHIITLGEHHVSIYLPVIIYDEGKWHLFMSSKLQHGTKSYDGFFVSRKNMNDGKLVKLDSNGNEIRPTLDISLTKNVLSILMSMAFMIFVFVSIAKSYQKRKGHAPKGMQSFMEPLIIFIRDDVAKSSIGEDKYERYLPFLLTLFFFILLNNLLGIVPFFPGGANITGNVGVTGVMAVFTFIITTVSGNKNYWRHIINAPGVPWWLKLPVPLMPIVEIMGLFTKPFVLMVRLFANMSAGHIIVLGFISLIFIFGKMSVGLGYGVSIVSVGFSIFMDLLEILVAFIQAYVFTLLSALYFGMATEEAHH